MDRRAADQRVDELLELVGIPRARCNQYPHQYSGGMRQRAMIAMALACSPDLLFADEPTTALDVMIQAQVFELLRQIQAEFGLAIVLVTHDLGVVAEMCDEVVVMYGGKVAEVGPATAVYNDPRHPYTQRLLAAFPDPSQPADLPAGGQDLATIPGTPPRLNALPPGCRFEPRCERRIDRCTEASPALVDVAVLGEEGEKVVARAGPEDLAGHERQLERRRLQVGEEDVKVVRVDPGLLGRLVEDELRVVDDVLVDGRRRSDQDRDARAQAPAGPPRLLAGGGDGARVTGEDGDVEAPDVDPELEGVRRDDAEDLAVAQPLLDGPALRGQVASAIAAHP